MKLLPPHVKKVDGGFIIKMGSGTAFIPFGFNRLFKEEARLYGKRVQEAFDSTPSRLRSAITVKKKAPPK